MRNVQEAVYMKKRSWKDILWAVEITLIIIMTLAVLYSILSPTDMASELPEREPVSAEETKNTSLQPEEEESKNQTVSDSVDSNPVDSSTIDSSNTNTPSYSSSSNSSSGYSSGGKKYYHSGYDDGYDDIYDDGDYDEYRYAHDSDYASGVEDAMDDVYEEYGEEW